MLAPGGEALGLQEHAFTYMDRCSTLPTTGQTHQHLLKPVGMGERLASGYGRWRGNEPRHSPGLPNACMGLMWRLCSFKHVTSCTEGSGEESQVNWIDRKFIKLVTDQKCCWSSCFRVLFVRHAPVTVTAVHTARGNGKLQDGELHHVQIGKRISAADSQEN